MDQVKKRLMWQGNLQEINDINRDEALSLLADVGVTKRGAELMVDKMMFKVIRLTNVDTRAANILKQTFLSKGADAAVSAATVNLAAEKTDVVIFATVKQIRGAVERLKEQPWGLRDVAADLEGILP